MVKVRIAIGILALSSTLPVPSTAADFEVGEGPGMLAAISDVPWESLGPGDRVLIHWRSTAYKEKWVICRRGTAEQPIVIRGVPGPGGALPVIDGRDAVTPEALNFWNESRGVLKIGGASIPADTLPAHIVIENLEIRSGRPPYSFTNDGGGSEAYSSNAAAVYVEKAEHLVIRNCILRDSGNGLFIGAYDGDTQDILIEHNWIYDNGIEGSYYEHNTYTAAIGITYQFNRLGRLREGCGGNNLKDRSAGLVVRYNWIEDGNRQLDLVDAEDSAALVNHPDYHKTYVYGNVLIESEGEGNSQILHYGGDSGTTADYRKGTLYFHHNTVISTRSGNTTLMRLSTNDEHADIRNNILFTTADGSRLAIVDASGVADLRTNWIMDGWVDSHSGLSGTLTDHGDNITGTDPGFTDFAGQDFTPLAASACVDMGGPLDADVVSLHSPVNQYLRHRRASTRPDDGPRDIGALESGLIFGDAFESGSSDWWSLTLP
jgi:hypothetical protein